MKNELRKSIETMTHRIVSVLEPNKPTIYLYGSAAVDDFKRGWSDIDILVLTRAPTTDAQAQQLLHLRQNLLAEEQGNPHYRAFEGGMLTLDCFLSKEPDSVVYWGTSGERIATEYKFDSFGMMHLLDSAIVLYGEDVRALLRRPTYAELREDVRRHYESIRQHARKTGRDLYSYGWLLDISRCLYTLRTGQIIAKTGAGEWALGENLCPCADALEKALQIRKAPERYLADQSIFDYAETLGAAVQKYADVLERELNIG